MNSRPQLSIWKHRPGLQGCFSSIIISQLRRTTEFKFSQVCYLMHCAEIHQVRRLLFYNSQRGPVPLSYSTLLIVLFVLGPNLIELLFLPSKVTNQITMSCVQSVTGTLLIFFIKQNMFKEYFLLRQLYKIGPWSKITCTNFVKLYCYVFLEYKE